MRSLEIFSGILVAYSVTLCYLISVGSPGESQGRNKLEAIGNWKKFQLEVQAWS